MRYLLAGILVWLALLCCSMGTFGGESQESPATMPSVQVAENSPCFVLYPSGHPFIPWGFNYDHDEKGRLLEDYWHKEWPKVEQDFQELRKPGANVVRVHLQFGKFMVGPDKPNAASARA
jgi:hypothetical protein